MIKSITTSHSFEELRTTQYANTLQPLVTYLSDNVHHPATVHALLYITTLDFSFETCPSADFDLEL